MSRRLITTITPNTPTASYTYTGSGVGKIDLVAEVTLDDGTVQSNTYEVLDCLYYNENDLTSDTNLNDTPIGDGDFGAEFSICPTSRTSSYGFLRIGTVWNNGVIIGQINSAGECFVRLMVDGVIGSESSRKIAPLDTETTLKFTRVGNTYTLIINNETVSVTDNVHSGVSFKAISAVVTNNTIKGLKIYPM